MAELHLGVSRVDITPEIGCRLVGHLSRSRPAESVLDRLYARVLSLSDGRRRILIVNLDLLELGPRESDVLAGEISRRSGILTDAIFLTATHTHTGPPVIELAGVPVDEAYFDATRARVGDAVLEAMRAEHPVTLRAGSRRVRLGVNRRRIVDGRVVMAPDPEGPVDPELTVVSFDGPDGRPRGLLLNYAVHPTTLGVGLHCVSADFPGRLGRILTSEIGPRIEYAFLQGACGDVKPAIYDAGGGFKEGGEADIEGLGRKLADAVLRVLESAAPVHGRDIESASEPFLFSYGPMPTEGELAEQERAYGESAREPAALAGGPADDHVDPLAAARYMAGWAGRMRGRLAAGGFPSGVEACLRFFRIGRDVVFVGVPGELFSETGLAIKRASPFGVTLVGGYTGGSLGYFPTAQALRDGGYEASDAYKYYGHPAPFAPETTETLVSRCRAVFERIGKA